VLRTFYANAAAVTVTAAFAALRKQMETTSIFSATPVGRQRTRPVRVAITFNQWLWRCGTARFVALKSTQARDLKPTYLALRSSGPWQDNGQQDFAICSCL